MELLEKINKLLFESEQLQTVFIKGNAFMADVEGDTAEIGEMRPSTKPNFRALTAAAKQLGLKVLPGLNSASKRMSKSDWEKLMSVFKR